MPHGNSIHQLPDPEEEPCRWAWPDYLAFVVAYGPLVISAGFLVWWLA